MPTIPASVEETPIMSNLSPVCIAPGKRKMAGFMLIESLLAMLIFSIGILALVGFQGMSIKLVGDSKQRANAAFVASHIEGELWAVNPANLADCAGSFEPPSSSSCAGDWGARLVGLPNGVAEVEVNGSQVTLTITWQQPGADEEHRYVHNAQILHN
jgi:type IV pilus assembly protein PilV